MTVEPVLPAPASDDARGVRPSIARSLLGASFDMRIGLHHWTVQPSFRQMDRVDFPTGIDHIDIVTAMSLTGRRLSEVEATSRHDRLTRQLVGYGASVSTAGLRMPGTNSNVPAVAVIGARLEDVASLVHDLEQIGFTRWRAGALDTIWIPAAGDVSSDHRPAATVRVQASS